LTNRFPAFDQTGLVVMSVGTIPMGAIPLDAIQAGLAETDYEWI